MDVSAVVTAWGTWQPALDPNRRPSVSDALVGSLGDSSGANGSRFLLDIGAGQGLFSLAVAARGHRAIALEASPLSADPFQVCSHYQRHCVLLSLSPTEPCSVTARLTPVVIANLHACFKPRPAQCHSRSVLIHAFVAPSSSTQQAVDFRG